MLLLSEDIQPAAKKFVKKSLVNILNDFGDDDDLQLAIKPNIILFSRLVKDLSNSLEKIFRTNRCYEIDDIPFYNVLRRILKSENKI